MNGTSALVKQKESEWSTFNDQKADNTENDIPIRTNKKTLDLNSKNG